MDQKLKQRLTGALVLVALAVIFVPIILEGPDNEWSPRSHSIPEQPQMDYRADMELKLPQQPAAAGVESGGVITEALSLPADPAPTTTTATPVASAAMPSAAPETAPSPEPSPATPVKTAKPVSPAKPAPTPAPEKKKKKKSAHRPALKGWFVQVGSFGEQMNASGLRDRLKRAGYAVRLQKVAIGGGNAYRVLVGPSGSREGAEKNAASLKSTLELSGMVIEYP